MKKIRKQIDIPEDDFAALQLLAARQGTNLKNCIEKFLHQLAGMAINQELELRIAKVEKEKEPTKENQVTNPS